MERGVEGWRMKGCQARISCTTTGWVQKNRPPDESRSLDKRDGIQQKADQIVGSRMGRYINAIGFPRSDSHQVNERSLGTVYRSMIPVRIPSTIAIP